MTLDLAGVHGQARGLRIAGRPKRVPPAVRHVFWFLFVTLFVARIALAQASIMSRTMIRYGSRRTAVTDRGFSLLRRAIIDQHFLVRDRQERLLNVLTDRPHMIGLGVDEGTALVVRQNRLRVIGDSGVVVCVGETDGREAWVRALEPGMICDLVGRTVSTEARTFEVDLRVVSAKK